MSTNQSSYSLVRAVSIESHKWEVEGNLFKIQIGVLSRGFRAKRELYPVKTNDVGLEKTLHFSMQNINSVFITTNFFFTLNSYKFIAFQIFWRLYSSTKLPYLAPSAVSTTVIFSNNLLFLYLFLKLRELYSQQQNFIRFLETKALNWTN